MSENYDGTGGDDLELGGWSPKRFKVAMLLSVGLPIKEVAAQANVSRETVWRYQQIPGFDDLVDRLSWTHFRGLVNGMWSLGGHSMEVLHGALDELDTDAALDIFKTIAPGLRDVSRSAPPEENSASPASSDAGDSEDAAEQIDAAPGTDHMCPHCARKTKSARGLTQHIKLKH